MSLIDKTTTINIPAHVATVFQTILPALQNIKGLKFTRAKENEFTIELDGKISWWSWGEFVTVACRYVNDSMTTIEIVSRPKMPTTIVDYGKGSRNVKKVIDALHTVLNF